MDAFDVLADPTRRRLVELLSERSRTVGDLTQRLSLSQPAVSKQLALLRTAGILSVTAEGTRRWYRVRPEGLAEVTQWLAKYSALWETSLESLDQVLSESRRPSRRP